MIESLRLFTGLSELVFIIPLLGCIVIGMLFIRL